MTCQRRVWRTVCLPCATACVLFASTAMADMFGTGVNQFSIDFVTISADTNPTSGISAGTHFTFTGVAYDYRMGVYEITNDQWNKFKTQLGVPVTGNLANAYDQEPTYTAPNVPTNRVSWYEAAQFVNWLNTSTGHQAAYRFTGEQGTSSYTLALWDLEVAAGGANQYRHKDAFYFCRPMPSGPRRPTGTAPRYRPTPTPPRAI
ncbi:MAG: SUMF1/EgtB/PvdO family nonheme iron enzyme [Patescibacteria group bacterium]|nr:SUMF1/EgtB/PvdO family nonheme iron enzyme [Patescibacteria group bacterium]